MPELNEVRGIFLPPELHAQLKAFATTLRTSAPVAAAPSCAALALPAMMLLGYAWRNQHGIDIIIDADDERANDGAPVYQPMCWRK